MSHRLDRLELEIQTADEALARPLLERLSRLHHQALQDVLARVLDQLSPAGAVHRLERLELDLGEIPSDRLERELPLRLERALREALPARLPEALVREAPPPVDPAGAADDPTVARQLELLASYANSGQLPWWAPRDDPRQIPTALEVALAIARELPAAERASWWERLAADGIARERLLAAAEAAQRPGLRQALLEGLLPEGQTAGLPKPRAVVANAERQEAAEEANRERLEAAEEANRERLEATEAANADRLGAFQTPLEQAAPVGDGSTPVDGAGAVDDPTVARQLELLASYASSGQLPWWAPRDDPRQIPAALEVALAIAREVPAAERASWWRTLAPDGIARERLLAAAEAAQRPGLRQALLEGLLPDSQTAGLPKPRAVVANAERQEAAEEANRERLEAAEEANRERLEATEAANADRLGAFQTPLEQAAPVGDGSTPVDGAGAVDDPTVARQLELLASYASSGQLPWWAPRDDPRQIPAALEVALAIARELPAAERASWWRTLAPDGIARERLLAAAEAAQRPGLRQALLEGLLPDSQTAGLPKPRAVVANAERQEAAEEANRERLEAAEEANRERLEATEAANADRLDDAERANRERQEAAEGALPGREPPRPSDPASAAPGSSQPRRGAQGAVDRLELLGLPIVPARAAAPSLEEPLTVDGAGLVLLCPFLETLLSRLAWLTAERAFLGAAEQQRAVALLGYLVEGDPRPPEWRLTLAKLLCGVALEEVCAPEEPLEEVEVAEAEALLRAVLAHGEGLLGKANEELRQEWLRRPGLLSWRPGAWLLVVERREGDDALEQLPWRWDWIRLPWMAELLQVVW